MTCAARRQNDQMVCGPCATQWDIGDPEPPVCGLQCLATADRPRDEDARAAGYTPLIRFPYGRGADAVLDREFDDAADDGWQPHADPDYEAA